MMFGAMRSFTSSSPGSIRPERLREDKILGLEALVSAINREWLERLDEAEWLRSRIRELSGD